MNKFVQNIWPKIGIAIVFVMGLIGVSCAAEVDAENSKVERNFFGNIDVLLAMDASVPVRTRYLQNPYRIIFEFEDLDFGNLPLDFAKRNRRIKSLNFGQTNFGARMVFTFDKPYRLGHLDMLKQATDGLSGVRLEFEKTSEETFAELATELAYNAEDVEYVLPKISDGLDQLPLIVIDPGHGGVDPGATREGVVEKDVTLNAARHLHERLLATGRYRVALTRNSDVYLPLSARRRAGEQLRADLFLSVHADTVEMGDARGTTIYTLSDQATSEVAREFARFENRVDVFAGEYASESAADIHAVLLDFAQYDSIENAKRIADLLRGEWVSINRDASESRLESAKFVVLKAPEIPSILLEIGYLSNAIDRINMQNPIWLDQMSDGVVAAVDSYFNLKQ